MSATIRVVFEDAGGDPLAGGASGAPLAGAPPAPRADDRVTGPEKRKSSSGPDLARDGGKAADMLAGSLGLGGLATLAKGLAESYRALFDAVLKSTAAHQANASVVDDAATGKIVGPKKTPALPGPPPITIDDISPDVDILGDPRDVLARATTPATPKQLGQAAKIARSLPGPVAAAGSVTGPLATAGATAGPAAGASGAAAGSSMAALSAAAGPAAIAIAATTIAVVGMGVAVKKLSDFLKGEADRLSAYSGPLSAATARSDIRSELSDIRRAERIGPQLARFENQRARGEEALHNVMTAVLVEVLKIADQAGPAIDAMIAVANKAAEYGPIIGDAVKMAMLNSIHPSLGQIVMTLGWFKKHEEGKLDRAAAEKEFEDDEPFLLDFLNRFPGGGFAGVPAPTPIPGSPGIAASAFARGRAAGGGP
ncbi:MAG: hypothetical protein WD872_17650 [Pirellulaceae bacterium]